MKGQNSEVQPQVWKPFLTYREKSKENNTQKTHEQHVQRLFAYPNQRSSVFSLLNFGWAPFFLCCFWFSKLRICSFVFISVQSGFSTKTRRKVVDFLFSFAEVEQLLANRLQQLGQRCQKFCTPAFVSTKPP